jgi:16S rRNA (cytosine1402-N4)-methyltransferase
VRSAVPARFARKALARVFQALRIVTNHEIENIRQGLAGALEVLVPAGRLVVLSYHSLEDREAKQFLRAGRIAGRLRILTPKPVRPSPEEVAANPRSRSARLRAAEVIS